MERLITGIETRTDVSCSSWPGLLTAAGILQVLGLLLSNPEFQLCPYIIYWVQVWRLALPLQDLKCLL